MDDQTAEELLRRVADRTALEAERKLAFNEFYREFFPIGERHAKRVLFRAGFRGDIEQEKVEVMQLVMADVWEKSAAKFDGRVPVRAWLFGIVRNKSIDVLRRRGAEPPPDFDRDDDEASAAAPELASNDPSPFDRLSDKQTAELVRRCVERLPYSLRLCVELTLTEEGFSLEEIGAILGCPEGTVKSRMFNARKRLRACLELLLGLSGGEA